VQGERLGVVYTHVVAPSPAGEGLGEVVKWTSPTYYLRISFSKIVFSLLLVSS
jgi:hypothetical protein